MKLTATSADDLEIIAVSSYYPEIGVRIYVNRTEVGSAEIFYDGTIQIAEGEEDGGGEES